jgi:DNA-binding transcriptional ArsR family regulator
MPGFNFSSDSPGHLMVECDQEDLFRAVKELPQWHARALEMAGAALAYWVGTVVARPRDREGLGELRSLIRRLQVIQPLDRQDASLDVAGHYRQWNGMVAVLEARAHLIDRHGDTAEIEGRAHMQALRDELQAAGTAGLATRVLQNRLRLDKARMSQVLALAEAAGLVERRRDGREKIVSAAGRWRVREPAASPVPASVLPFSAKRGAHLLAA